MLDIVENEFDLVDEGFLSADEKVAIFNRGIQKAAADIYKLGIEDEYFQDEAALAMVSGASEIALPTNIYGHKIREIIYRSGTKVYEVKRTRRRSKFLQEERINAFSTGNDFYLYRIRNAGTAGGVKIKLIPAAKETSATVMTCYFMREAEFIPLVSAGSLAASRAAKIDLPPCANYIISYGLWRVAKKIPHPDLASYKDERDEERALMIDTLTRQIDDDNDEAIPDTTHYEESS